MLVLGQNGIITFILPAFAAAHCFGPAVLPRFCCYHVWPVGQPLEDLCSYVACDSPSLRCQVNVKSNELLSTMLMYIFFEETFLLLEIKRWAWAKFSGNKWSQESFTYLCGDNDFFHFPEIPPTRFLQAIVAYLFVSRRQRGEKTLVGLGDTALVQ